MAEKVEVLVDGGKASAGPPLGPALGPTGVNVMDVVKAINDKTKDFAGMKVPVVVEIDPKKKTFDISVGTPPASALILQEIGVKSGSGECKTNKVGNLSNDQVAKIARMKADNLMGADLAAKGREIAGTCVSMGVTIEGLDPREWQKKSKAGEYADAFSE